MQDLNALYFSSLTNDLAPTHWTLDQANGKAVSVKDARGDILFHENFGEIPTDISEDARNRIIERSKLFAQWLVSFSNDRAAH